jgi:hypothetical protein
MFAKIAHACAAWLLAYPGGPASSNSQASAQVYRPQYTIAYEAATASAGLPEVTAAPRLELMRVFKRQGSATSSANYLGYIADGLGRSKKLNGNGNSKTNATCQLMCRLLAKLDLLSLRLSHTSIVLRQLLPRTISGPHASAIQNISLMEGI